MIKADQLIKLLLNIAERLMLFAIEPVVSLFFH